MKLIPKMLLLAGLMSLSTAVLANVMYAEDVSGKYTCNGYDPYTKTSYTAPATIFKTGNTYSFEWNQSNTNHNYYGTGIYYKNDGRFAVSFWNPNDAKYFGVFYYQVEQDGSLKGTWTIAKGEQVGTETCKRMA